MRWHEIVNEMASVGATCASAIAVVPQSTGAMLSRGQSNGGQFFGQSPFDPTGMGIYSKKQSSKKNKRKNNDK